MLHHLDTTKKPLIGRSLQAINRINDNSVMIEFCDGSKCQLEVDGNCCSRSIFYEIEMPENLTGSILEDIIEGDWNDESESKITADAEDVALEKIKKYGFDFCPEENKVWNIVLKTNRGYALIRHINASNGYYDGYTTYTFDDTNCVNCLDNFRF